MADIYTKPTISGFNTDPPSDDGANTANNEIEWQKHLDKIGTPLKSYADGINNNVDTAFGSIYGNAINPQSADYTVQASDRGKLISCTNTITITLLAAATAESGFVVAVRNAGTGVVTIDGNASETINGLTTYTLAQGQEVTLTTSGTAWETLALSGGLRSHQVFTTDGTWTRPAGVRRVVVEVQGGGANGKVAAGTDVGETSAGPGGGGGGYAKKLIDVSAIASATVTVGGAGLASIWSDGTNTLTGSAGLGGSTSAASSGAAGRTGGEGGSASGGDINIPGQPGGAALFVGESGAANLDFAMSGAGGNSVLGMGGRQQVIGSTGTTADGEDGSNYGGGGSGGANGESQATTNGSFGAPGVVIVWEYS